MSHLGDWCKILYDADDMTRISVISAGATSAAKASFAQRVSKKGGDDVNHNPSLDDSVTLNSSACQIDDYVRTYCISCYVSYGLYGQPT